MDRNKNYYFDLNQSWGSNEHGPPYRVMGNLKTKMVCMCCVKWVVVDIVNSLASDWEGMTSPILILNDFCT